MLVLGLEIADIVNIVGIRPIMSFTVEMIMCKIHNATARYRIPVDRIPPQGPQRQFAEYHKSVGHFE